MSSSDSPHDNLVRRRGEVPLAAGAGAASTDLSVEALSLTSQLVEAWSSTSRLVEALPSASPVKVAARPGVWSRWAL
ncbi:UNVERIFIED_CONTAM: hypothetical protein Sradi_5233300 [Sesamum radiatum]|uniref:Uncharacterized protein n=1 Tax=Sesamum radiatum TaxID=300843 RepID=A0AAW2LN71_SESRA